MCQENRYQRIKRYEIALSVLSDEMRYYSNQANSIWVEYRKVYEDLERTLAIMKSSDD